MPAPEDVPPESWKVIVLVMRSGGYLFEALRFAYQVLRRNFQEPEAHRAYLAALLVGGPRPSIPSAVVAGPGTAVAFKEDGSMQEEWRVIEEEFEPDATLQEIGPDHFIAKQLNGKRVGESFVLAQGSVTSTKATVTQILSKYVYRFQDCGGSWQRRFPGLPDIQSLRVIKAGPGGTQEFDLTDFFASLDRIVAHQEEVLTSYRHQPIPIHVVAQALSRTEFEQMIRMALADEIGIRCCIGSAEERAEAISALKNSEAIVLDLTAVATLSLLGAVDALEQFPTPILISELTLAELRNSLSTASSDDGEAGFVGKEGSRYVLEQLAPEAQQERHQFLKSITERITARCTVVGCPELAAVESERREFLVKALGEHGAQSIVLATSPRRVLWTDDFVLSLVAKQEFGVRRIWTQVALQERAEVGAISPERFFEATARLIGCRYYFTSPSPQALTRAGSLADWDPVRRPLKQALDIFSDTGIVTRDILALAVPFILQCTREIALPEVRNAVIVTILEGLAARGEGLVPINALIVGLRAAFGLDVVRSRDIEDVIRAWIATRQATRFR
ncbi:MAG TPA: hypothetical protein VMT20_06330 [Terriglobia bacterium]|nr:hypothetical protein [Terriglobia bacterium]